MFANCPVPLSDFVKKGSNIFSLFTCECDCVLLLTLVYFTSTLKIGMTVSDELLQCKNFQKLSADKSASD